MDNNLENVIDRILFSATNLKKKLENLNPHITEDQTRNAQKIKQMEKENRELRQALEDHQYGLEFIMNKYRSQIVELMKLNKRNEATNESSLVTFDNGTG